VAPARRPFLPPISISAAAIHIHSFEKLAASERRRIVSSSSGVGESATAA
jgi:hypothetical protein